MQFVAFDDCYGRTVRLTTDLPTLPLHIPSELKKYAIRLLSSANESTIVNIHTDAFNYIWTFCIIKTYRRSHIQHMTANLLTNTFYTAVALYINNMQVFMPECVSAFPILQTLLTSIIDFSKTKDASMLYKKCANQECILTSDGKSRCRVCSYSDEVTEFNETEQRIYWNIYVSELQELYALLEHLIPKRQPVTTLQERSTKRHKQA